MRQHGGRQGDGAGCSKEILLFSSQDTGSIVLENFQNHGINDISVILPMVLQIRKTMVLQRIELGGKGSLSHFCPFGLSVARVRKHGFAEKVH